jgi:CBS domain-containing protein
MVTEAHTPAAATEVAAIEHRPAILIMRDPVIIPATASPADAQRALAAHGVEHLVVVDQIGRAMKLLESKDVVAFWDRDAGRYETATLIEVCGPRRPFINATATVKDAARVIDLCGSTAVGVVDDECLPSGLVTATDIVEMLDDAERERNMG